MFKSFIHKQINTLKSTLSDRADATILISVFTFILLNVLKVTVFNHYISSTQTPHAFKYKFVLTLLVFMVLYPFIFKLKSRVLISAGYLLQTVYILVNISYYIYFNNYLSPMQWFALVKEGFLAARHSSAPVNATLLIAFIDFPVLVYMLFRYARVYSVNTRLYFYRYMLVMLSLLGLTYIEVQNYSRHNSLYHFTTSRYAGESQIVERYGTAVNGAINLFKSRSENELIKDLKYGKEISNNIPSQDKPNIIIIQLESVDSNIINLKHDGKYVAPYLQSLSGKSIFYPYTLSYHAGGGTSDSEFSIINSMEPLLRFPALKLSSYQYPNSMLSRLTEADYETYAFHGNVGSFFNRNSAFPKMGFMEFYDLPKMNLKDSGWGAPDSDVFNFAAKRIESIDRPFLSYIITMTNHGPFTNARNYHNDSRFDSVEDELAKNYFNSISYVDKCVMDFVEKVRADYKNTYFFIFGDHAPGVNTKIYQDASFRMYDRSFEFVPLFILTPDNKVYKEERQVATFLDFSPTILYASGIKFIFRSDGRNLITREGGNDIIPFKGRDYDRTYLFQEITKK